MANCKKCGEFFQPTPDEERLIATHQIDEVCMPCAMAETVGKEDDYKPGPPRIPIGKYDGSKLHRAERFDKDGKLLCFVALPPKQLRPRHKSLRKPRRGIIHVSIISGNDAYRMSSQPQVVLHTNLESFRHSGQPLWFTKIPGFWDPHTGVARIEIPNADVDCIVGDAPEREVRMKDGSFIKLTYM